MNAKFLKAITKYQNFSFIRVANKTMITLFPVILIGAFSWTLSYCFANPVSLFGRIVSLNSWFPQAWFLRAILGDLFTVTSGTLALYGALISARETAILYKIKPLFAELFSVISYLLIFHHSLRGNQNAIEMRYYSAYWLIMGIVIGYVVGLIFAKFTVFKKDNDEELVDLARNSSRPIVISVILALLLHILFALVRTYNLDQIAFQNITSFFSGHSSYWMSILVSIISTLLMWLGFAGTLEFNNSVFNNEAAANLNHYLLNKSYQKIPYPFTPAGFFDAFAQIGGIGCTLALLIAILIISKKKRNKNIAIWSAIPVIFNANLPLALGIPVILNPLLLIPFVLTPIVNMLLGSLAIAIGMFPPLVFPTPVGTPGILRPLIASGGNWISLLVMMLLLVIDVLIYIPFIQKMEQLEIQEGEN